MLYTPLANPEGNVLCMNWDHSHEYQTKYGHREDFNEELISFFFEREVKNIEVFKKFEWAPLILDIDVNKKQIFIEWNKETCNNIVYGGRSLDNECPSWKIQMSECIKDIMDAGYYKLSLYPHCYFVDQKGKLKTFDFYACATRSNPYIEINKIKGMIGPNSQRRFDEVLIDNVVDLEKLFKRALQQYIKWPDDFLVELHDQIFS
jgi:hypothetical protein